MSFTSTKQQPLVQCSLQTSQHLQPVVSGECVNNIICWPLPSNQSFYTQIASYQRVDQ